ncbi:ATP synthase, F0 complex, subunit G, mitochondrial [Sesbania bispinosa]|nr:ATP synthase, F0 complex, subunit G, mitochondrial [Sesbania bispinosa]
MASKILQLQSKVTQASEVVVNHGASYYKLLLEQNKHYIQDPPTIEKCQLLAKQLFYTRLASIPNRCNSFWKELDYVKNLMKNRQDLNIENAGLAALFGLECFAWFCGGTKHMELSLLHIFGGLNISITELNELLTSMSRGFTVGQSPIQKTCNIHFVRFLYLREMITTIIGDDEDAVSGPSVDGGSESLTYAVELAPPYGYALAHYNTSLYLCRSR